MNDERSAQAVIAGELSRSHPKMLVVKLSAVRHHPFQQSYTKNKIKRDFVLWNIREPLMTT